MKRLSCGRRLYKCEHPDHTSDVVWTIKTMGEHCNHTRIQPECRRFCCSHCPLAVVDVNIDTSKELRNENEQQKLLVKLRALLSNDKS